MKSEILTDEKQCLELIDLCEFSPNNYNESSFNFPAPSYMAVEEEEEQQEEEEEETQIITQASTSDAVVAKKRGRGRPADSPGTKLRKAAEKSTKTKKSK